MKMSTKGRYGLRAIIDLAIHSEKEAASLSGVAKRQNLSISYLEQLISLLKKANLVTSTRGAMGGYMLARSAESISVGDVLRALEGDLNPVDCDGMNNSSSTCIGADQCVTRYVWERIRDSMNETVNHITLQELMEESHRLCRKEEE